MLKKFDLRVLKRVRYSGYDVDVVHLVECFGARTLCGNSSRGYVPVRRCKGEVLCGICKRIVERLSDGECLSCFGVVLAKDKEYSLRRHGALLCAKCRLKDLEFKRGEK